MDPSTTQSSIGSAHVEKSGHRLLPFFMVYDSEAILPTDIAFGAPHTQNFDEGEAEIIRRTDLDSVEEHRLTAASSTPGMSSSYVVIMTKTSSSATSTSATWYSDGSSPRRQANFPMGRPLHRKQRSHPRNLQAAARRWNRCGQPIEH